MRKLVKDFWPFALFGVVMVVALVVYPRWQQEVDRNRDARADPHHIAGGLYFVGAPDLAAFLLVGTEGHVLIGSGDQKTARKIIDSVEHLGFHIRDVKVLLATDPHEDEAGGFAELQRASGAQLWASEANAAVIVTGGKDDPSIVYTPYTLLALAGVTGYPAARVDHIVKDGDTVRAGVLALTAHITPGHAPGCTTWTFTVREGDRDLRVVHRCQVGVPYGASLVEPEHPMGVRDDFERGLRTLRALDVDIWLTSHGRDYGRFRKYDDSRRSAGAITPFIDPKGYAESLDAAEDAFRNLLTEQQQGSQQKRP
ncbi:MAG: MBL fold metallo-hydrolase [Vicinamibacterales bacterium]